jgi:hypothetical protein
MKRADLEEFVEHRFEKLGYGKLLPEEQEYIAVWELSVDVINGGFEQYFHNSFGDRALEASQSLKHLRANKAASLLSEALTVLDSVGGYTKVRGTRRRRLSQLKDSTSAFELINDRFYEGTEDFVSKSLKRVAAAYRRNEINRA